jgi:ethanolamine ammonia-lyase large subunit
LFKTQPYDHPIRLDHCQSEVINQLTNQKIIELIKDDHDQEAFKTIKCKTCAVFKMYSLVFKISTTKVIKFFQRLHFNLIILKKIEFDKTIERLYRVIKT